MTPIIFPSFDPPEGFPDDDQLKAEDEAVAEDLGNQQWADEEEGISKGEPLWKGPGIDGITFSLLCDFLECRERFRLRVVEGLVEDEGFNHAVEYGSMWHECEEAHSAGKPWEPCLKEYRRKLILLYPTAEGEINKWHAICKTQFPIYVDYWSKHPDEKTRKPLLEEVSFKVPYTLPSGRTVLLRGKWDAILLLPLTSADTQRSPDLKLLARLRGLKPGSPLIYLQENKTKGKIDETGILQAVAGNLQTMTYQIALHTLNAPGSHDLKFLPGDQGIKLAHALSTAPIAGTLYNVVRRPLSDHYAIRQRKSETMTQFYARLGEKIREESFDTKGRAKPDCKHFMRWKVELTPAHEPVAPGTRSSLLHETPHLGDIETFKQRSFNPILEQLCDWWEWIKADPFNPWQPRDNPIAGDKVHEYGPPVLNTVHFQSPWGVYNSLASGWRGSYFEYLTLGRDRGLNRITNLFPELDDGPAKTPS